MHMMGKRVNYAARSVISPDPYLNTDQVGVPLRFAKSLSYKTPVTPWNVAWLRGLVINGAAVWPGATHVEDEAGGITDLSTLPRAKREAIADNLWRASSSLGAGAAFLAGVGARAAGEETGLEPIGQAVNPEIDPGATAAAAAANGRGTAGVGVKRVWRHLMVRGGWRRGMSWRGLTFVRFSLPIHSVCPRVLLPPSPHTGRRHRAHEPAAHAAQGVLDGSPVRGDLRSGTLAIFVCLQLCVFAAA